MAPLLGNAERIDPDHLSIHIEQRSAGVARIDRCVVLDQIVVIGLRQIASQRADDSRGNGVGIGAKRRPNRQYGFADLQLIRVAKRRERGHLAVDLHYGEIADAIRSHEGGRSPITVRQENLELLAPVDHMPVGDHMAFRIDNESSARAHWLDGIESLEHLLVDDRHDRRADLLHDRNTVVRRTGLLRDNRTRVAAGKSPTAEQPNGKTKQEE